MLKGWTRLCERTPSNAQRCFAGLSADAMRRRPKRCYPLKGKRYEGCWGLRRSRCGIPPTWTTRSKCSPNAGHPSPTPTGRISLPWAGNTSGSPGRIRGSNRQIPGAGSVLYASTPPRTPPGAPRRLAALFANISCLAFLRRKTSAANCRRSYSDGSRRLFLTLQYGRPRL